MSYRPDSLFDVSELTYVECEPTLYICNNFPEANYSIEYDGSNFIITVFGRTAKLSIADQNLKKIRHEIVSGVMSFVTDQPLSLIGVVGEESALTPDYINTKTKIVVEVATRAVAELYSVKNAFQEKDVKYGYLVKPKGYSLIPLIVSPSSVYTNCQLSDDVITSLCLRARIGLSIENLIIDKIGEDIFSEDLTLAEQYVADVFREITLIPGSEENFDVEKILSVRDNANPDDWSHTGTVLGKTLQESTIRSRENDETLKTYLNQFTEENCRTDDKRICNIPMIYLNDINFDPKRDIVDLDPNNSMMPSYLHTIWNASLKVSSEKDSLEEQINRSMKEAMGEINYDQHKIQKNSAFKVSLPADEKREASMTGLWAKLMEDDEELKQKETKDHLSFHPIKTSTQDIDTFIKTTLLDPVPNSALPKTIGSIIEHTKRLWTKNNSQPSSFKLLSKICRTKMGLFSQTITKIMTEIAYAYKYWIKKSDFYHKEIDNVHMLIRSTGTHVFVIYAFPKNNSTIIETGRLGPELYESNNYIFSDVCSYNEPTLEHFVKSSAYLVSIVSHLTSNFEMPLDNIVLTDKRLSETMNSIMLLFLNNKTDAEELITSQRYFTMGLMEELDPNPYRFTDRLPDVYRSRLTCHIVKRTIRLMNHYANKRIIKVPTTHSGDVFADYRGVLSIFGDFELSFRQKINEFYYGYVISKERGRGSDRNFKIMKKIVQEEYKFRDTVKMTLEKTLDPKTHQSDPVVMKIFCRMFRNYLQRMLGTEYDTVIKVEIIKHLARTSFSELATLKVASRSYSDNIIIPVMPESATAHEMFKILADANPEEIEKRPRVMEALAILVKAYKDETNKDPQHPIQLMPYCLKKLNLRGYFDSDIFPKPQHGGDREIHVLEIFVRMVQFYMEQISKVMCRLTPSDTLTHPSEKESFVKKHYIRASSELGETYMTLGKSADATKWCQRNHSSKFAAILVGIVPKMFHPLIIQLMKLWQHKRISFPIQFAGNFLSNKNVESNKIYKRMQKEFLTGTGIFPIAKNNKMIIKSGMMQGILHYTSSITHGVIQVVMQEIQQTYLKRKGIESVISIVQGSDDSAEIISLKGSVTKKKMQLATTMLHWKENISKWFSIYTSRAKSSIGSLDLVEYNSEWHVKGSVIKPTFRWVSACLETTVTERFIDRFRTNYGTLTQVLEGGGKILECSVIQMCQAWLHYMMLGFHNNILAHKAMSSLFSLKDPSLGFYPLDSDFNCSLTGVDFQLFHLFKKTGYGHGLSYSGLSDPSITDHEELETKDITVGKDLRSVKLKFGTLRIWFNMIRRMKVPELITLVEEVEKNPYLIFVSHHNWEMAKYSIYLKVFQPGVKESVSGFSATIRMMASSAYVISRPCITIMPDLEKGQRIQPQDLKKVSLLKALEMRKASKSTQVKRSPQQVFPFHTEYTEVLNYIEKMEDGAIYQKVPMRAKSKQKVMVFERLTEEVSISDLFKKKILKVGKLALSSRQVDIFWEQYKIKYPFLKDSLQDTKDFLGMSTIELKNFLEGLDTKPRDITLLDSTAKGSSLNSIMTRLYWPNTKILLPDVVEEEESSYSIRSKGFSILSSWLTETQKKSKLKNLVMQSTLLKQKRVPARVQKLKIFHDYYNEVDQSIIIRNIHNNKMGAVGYFTIRQSGWGRNRKGKGEWIGSCLGVPTKIRMMGTSCVSITVSNIQNLMNLGRTLRELIDGFCLEALDSYKDSEYWLTDSGKIIGGHGRSSCIPINVDTTLKVDIIDKISDYRWFWTISQTRLRLVAEVDQNTHITVMSDEFRSSDWDPVYPILDDPMLKSWSEGSPLDINMIEEELNSSYTMTASRALDVLKNMKEKPTKSAWDLQTFTEVLNYMICENNAVLTQPNILQNTKPDLDEMNEIMMQFNTAVIDFKIDNWADEVEDEEALANMDLFDVDDFDEELEAQLDLFSKNYQEDETYQTDKFKMPRTNHAFEPLNLYSRLQFHGLNFSDVVKLFKEKGHLTTTGLLSNLLTLIVKRICFPMRLSPEEVNLAKLQADVISVTTSLRSEKDLVNLEMSKINKNIEYLKSQIEDAPDEVKELMLLQLSKYERIKALRTSTPTQMEFLEKYNTFDVFIKIKQTLIDRRLIPSSYQALDDSVFCVVIKNELDCKIDEMTSKADLTSHEQSLYREAIGRSYVTSLLLDSITFRFNIRVKLANYLTKGLDDEYLNLSDYQRF